MEMFDEIVKTTVAPDGTSEVKRVPDDKFSDLCQAFLVADKRYHKANINVDMNSYASVCDWLDCLGRRYEAEKAMWTAFMASAESVPAMQRLYTRFRTALVLDQPLRANA